MSLSDSYDLKKLRNRSLEIASVRVEKFLDEHGEFCHCEQCVLDLLAYVLDHVTPMYGTSLLDPLNPDPNQYKKLNIDIDDALRRGSKQVSEHPSHEP